MNKHLRTLACWLVGAAAGLGSGLALAQQQTTGAPGSPNATTTVSNKQLPAPDPKFGGVGNEIAQMHYIGRSSNLSVVSLAQRPAWVPLSVLSNVSHAYIGRSRLANDAKRLADLGSVDPKELAQVMQALPTKHDFVYTPTQGEGRPAILNTRK